MLKVTGLHKIFDGTEILKGVDLEVDKGDIIVILGPSGSGKTTLLRCIDFLEWAEKGHLSFDGIELEFSSATRSQVSSVRKKIGFVFQNYNLFANKTVLQNVTEGLIIGRKVPEEQAVEMALKALDRVGLSDRLEYYPSQLSGGQQQRVGIARAVVMNPDVILFDEPTSALDPELVGEVLDVMKNLARDGATMVVVTHELNFARQVANKAVFMEDGIVVETGTPEKLFTDASNPRTRQFLTGILSH